MAENVTSLAAVLSGRARKRGIAVRDDCVFDRVSKKFVPEARVPKLTKAEREGLETNAKLVLQIAPTDKATCRACGARIGKHCVRLGYPLSDPRGDHGVLVAWSHIWPCARRVFDAVYPLPLLEAVAASADPALAAASNAGSYYARLTSAQATRVQELERAAAAMHAAEEPRPAKARKAPKPEPAPKAELAPEAEPKPKPGPALKAEPEGPTAVASADATEAEAAASARPAAKTAAAGGCAATAAEEPAKKRARLAPPPDAAADLPLQLLLEDEVLRPSVFDYFLCPLADRRSVLAYLAARATGAKLEDDGVEVDALMEDLVKREAALPPRVAPPADLMRADLLLFQQEGLAWMLQQEKVYRGGILADEMGMGKTIQTIGLLVMDKAGGGEAAGSGFPAGSGSAASGSFRDSGGVFAPAPDLHSKLGLAATSDEGSVAGTRPASASAGSPDRAAAGCGRGGDPVAAPAPGAAAVASSAGPPLAAAAGAAGAAGATSPPRVGLDDEFDGAVAGGTLVLAPLAAVAQWKSEVEKFTQPGVLSVLIYYGSRREALIKKLGEYDVVIASYATLESDYRRVLNVHKVVCKYCGRLFLPDKLRVHLRYFCGPGATRTAAQAKQEAGKAVKKAMKTLSIGDGDEDEAEKPPTISNVYRSIIREAQRSADAGLAVPAEGVARVPWMQRRGTERGVAPAAAEADAAGGAPDGGGSLSAAAAGAASAPAAADAVPEALYPDFLRLLQAGYPAEAAAATLRGIGNLADAKRMLDDAAAAAGGAGGDGLGSPAAPLPGTLWRQRLGLSQTDVGKKTVEELTRLMRLCGLSTFGRKVELVNRLTLFLFGADSGAVLFDGEGRGTRGGADGGGSSSDEEEIPLQRPGRQKSGTQPPAAKRGVMSESNGPARKGSGGGTSGSFISKVKGTQVARKEAVKSAKTVGGAKIAATGKPGFKGELKAASPEGAKPVRRSSRLQALKKEEPEEEPPVEIDTSLFPLPPAVVPNLNVKAETPEAEAPEAGVSGLSAPRALGRRMSSPLPFPATRKATATAAAAAAAGEGLRRSSTSVVETGRPRRSCRRPEAVPACASGAGEKPCAAGLQRPAAGLQRPAATGAPTGAPPGAPPGAPAGASAGAPPANKSQTGARRAKEALPANSRSSSYGTSSGGSGDGASDSSDVEYRPAGGGGSGDSSSAAESLALTSLSASSSAASVSDCDSASPPPWGGPPRKKGQKSRLPSPGESPGESPPPRKTGPRAGTKAAAKGVAKGAQTKKAAIKGKPVRGGKNAAGRSGAAMPGGTGGAGRGQPKAVVVSPVPDVDDLEQNYADPFDSTDEDDGVDTALSPLHAVRWRRVVLDEAHRIKGRTTSTAKAVYALRATRAKWCLTGTPLQNRIGELYSLVRFLRFSPFAFYFCQRRDCACRSLHYRFDDGRWCRKCTHPRLSHFSYFNRRIVTPIQKYGYEGEGRAALKCLKEEVLAALLLRRTKAERAADVRLPPLTVLIRRDPLSASERDFYESLYKVTRTKFDTYVASDTLLHNFAHIFDLLSRLRQACDHPYLIVYGKLASPENPLENAVIPAPGRGDAEVCGLCQEDVNPRELEVSACKHCFHRGCLKEYFAAAPEAAAKSALLGCPVCYSPLTVAFVSRVEEAEMDDSGKSTPDGGAEEEADERESEAGPPAPLPAPAGETASGAERGAFDGGSTATVPRSPPLGIFPGAADAVSGSDRDSCGDTSSTTASSSATGAGAGSGRDGRGPKCEAPAGAASGSRAAPLAPVFHATRSGILSRIKTSEFKSSTKLEALVTELEAIFAADDEAGDGASAGVPPAKCIVFSQYTAMLELIEWRVKKAGIHCAKLTGALSLVARTNVLRAFNEDPALRVILISLKAGGEGLNLQVANHIFLMDPWWNPAAELQAIQRAHRIGQTRPVRAVRFITENTIEEKILQLQEKKQLVFDGTVGASNAALAKLTLEDLRFLFNT